MSSGLDMRCGARGDLYHIELRSNISNLPSGKYIEFADGEHIDRRVDYMPESKNQLREESIDFAIAVSDICDDINGCSVYVNQLLRCSSSIGANLHEARYAQSRADFISKLEISLKECYESDYWLELLYRKNKLTSNQYTYLINGCGKIRRKLIASITTAKANIVKNN